MKRIKTFLFGIKETGNHTLSHTKLEQIQVTSADLSLTLLIKSHELLEL